MGCLIDAIVGVSNYEEYSLVRDIDELTPMSNGTLNPNSTLRKTTLSKNKEKVDAKMEQLKRKLKTDDDLNWVDNSKTLEEQEIGLEETLLFKRKFFYSDQNIDSRDPIQLHLLYVQTKEAIINGTHPVTKEQAIKFAAIQCQIEYGPSGSKAGIETKNFLPRDYCKVKNIDKKIVEDQREYSNLSKSEAQVKYVTEARSLKTYGVTFFLVKEKMQNKNKLVPRLLGVTKDSVLRLDEKTKEIMKTWPLTTVKRWAPTPNSFTLDFGDYSEKYYSVQTTEGEQIARLIAGYIDIILKRKKAKDHFGINGEESSAMIEDSIAPAKATYLERRPEAKPSKPIIEDVAIPGIIKSGTSGVQIVNVNQVQQEKQIPRVESQAPMLQSPVMAPQHPKYLQTGISGPEKALLGTIGTGQDAVENALKELDKKSNAPNYGSNFAYKQDQLGIKKDTVVSQLAALNAATAQVFTLTSVPEEEIDHPALGAAINTITSNLPEMSKDVRTIASLVDDRDREDRLVDAARNLCHAFSELLRAAEPSSTNRDNLTFAVNKVSDASSRLLNTIEEDDSIDRQASEMLLSLAKPVANATAKLVLKAKDVASKCDDQAAKNRVISAATQCAQATSQLVSCAKVVAPTIHNPNCQRQIVDSGRDVSKAVDGISRVCHDSVQDHYLNGEIDNASKDVNNALNNLLDYVRSLSDSRYKRTHDVDAVDTILDTTDRLFSSSGDASEMVKHAKILAQATSQLIQNIKGQAESQPDSDIQKRLLSAAKTLADATTRLVEAAKGCANNPHDSNSQAALRAAAQDLRSATNTAASNALRRKLVDRLEKSAKHATAMATQNINSVHGCQNYNANAHSQEELNRMCQEVRATLPLVLTAIKASQNEPDNHSKQSQLINACEKFINPSVRLASVSKSAVPTITDKSMSIQLSQSSQQLAEALSDLKMNLNKASEAYSISMEIEAALEIIRQLENEMTECRHAAINNTLSPLPDDDFDYCASKLSTASKSVASSLAQLLSSTSQGQENYIGPTSREVTNNLTNLASASRGIAAISNERDVQMRVLDNAIEILEYAHSLFDEIGSALQKVQDPERRARLTNVAKSISASLHKCVNSLPVNKEVDESIRSIDESIKLIGQEPMYSNQSYSELRNNISIAASKLNEATSEVIDGSRNPSRLAPASKSYCSNYSNLFTIGNEIASQTTDSSVQSQIYNCLQNLSTSSSQFLSAAKIVSKDSNAPNARSQLASAARTVTETISDLLDCSSRSAPGQNECDAAIQNIQMTRSLLDNPCGQINNSTYFECLEFVTEKSRRLGDAMTGIANHARKSEHERFGNSVKEASDSICGLIEGAAQSAYLIGISDPSSFAGKPGIIDLNTLQKCSDTINSSCRQIAMSNFDLKQLLKTATDIAKTTQVLCNACRVASTKTTSPSTRSNFVKSAKDIANYTAALIKEIKSLEDVNAQHVNENCRQATRPLIDAVDSLLSLASSPEFAPVPSRISPKARTIQEPIIRYGNSIIDASSSMIMSAKSLALNPKDPPGWQTLANHSKNVSDSIKRLVTSIKDASPGQNECDEAIEKISTCIKNLDQASLDSINRVLRGRDDQSSKGFRDDICASATEIGEHVNAVRLAGKSKAEKLGHAVTQMILYIEPIVLNSIGYASKIPDNKQQSLMLEKTKNICEHALQLIYSVKDCGGNPNATSIHVDIDDSSSNMRSSIQELLDLLESAASEDGHVNSIIETITKSITRIDERQYTYSNGNSSPDGLTYVDYQTRMVNLTKEIPKIAQDMVFT